MISTPQTDVSESIINTPSMVDITSFSLAREYNNYVETIKESMVSRDIVKTKR